MGIDLDDARDRVARATGAERSPWTPRDIRWIVAHWTLFRNELRQCREMEKDLMEIEESTLSWRQVAVRELVAGLLWWLHDAPPAARAGLGTLGLFIVAFVWGWL